MGNINNFVAINRSSNSNDIDNKRRIHLPTAYLSTSIISKSSSLSSYKLTDDDDTNHDDICDDDGDERIQPPIYVNLADLSCDEYDKFKNDNDYYKNRDNIIKKYVECGDKQKGTENIMEIYLKRWKEEERENIPKLPFCFDGICGEDEIQKKQKLSQNKKIKKKKEVNYSNKVRKTKKKKVPIKRTKVIKKSDGNKKGLKPKKNLNKKNKS